MKKENTKRMLSGIFALMMAAFLLAAIPTEAETGIYEDTLRLHILANSDSDGDQKLKLMIRDRILEKYGDVLRGGDFNEALTKANAMLPEIKENVDIWLSELGYNYKASVTLTEEWYDTREYEGFSLPAGRYMSLRVIIGEGNGKNWWCVMYPPLCVNIASESAPADDGLIDYTKEEITLIKGGRYNIKFKLLETFNAIFTKNG